MANHFHFSTLSVILLTKEPFAKLETALYEVPAPESCLDIAKIQWPKHLDEGISRHNLVPPQIEKRL